MGLPLPLDDVRLFTEALDRIRMSYVEEIDDRTLLENAIRGMLANLDPHSGFVDGSDFDTLQETTTGEFGGLGVEVGQENGYILIIAPIDDTPADRAGRPLRRPDHRHRQPACARHVARRRRQPHARRAGNPGDDYRFPGRARTLRS